MKILNLYACLGGNRYKWNEVKSHIEVTAVELDPECARLYQERFPNDKVIIGDAHKYLLDLKNSGELDSYSFVWSSPPCPSHSRARFARRNTTTAVYPDMKLYEEILFLKHYFNGKYVVENVIPYYEPLIPAKKRGRHLYWTNFNLPNKVSNRKNPDITRTDKRVQALSKFHDYDFMKYKGTQRTDKIARNLVDYEAGKTIFETVLGIYKSDNANQTKLF